MPRTADEMCGGRECRILLKETTGSAEDSEPMKGKNL